jgi:hypothetical protein
MRVQTTIKERNGKDILTILDAVSDTLAKMDSRISDMERRSFTGLNHHLSSDISHIKDMVRTLKTVNEGR